METPFSLLDLVKRYDRPGPRYTGYPMPPVWREPFSENEVMAALERANARQGEPLSLYAHIPFCRRRCTYCGCNAIASPRYTPVEAFLQAMEAEIELWSRHLPNRREAVQLHWGGGTPTYLQAADLRRLFAIITSRFTLLPGSEVAVEVDPTFLTLEQLEVLRELGFNRVSFGIQDLDPQVQALIGRSQNWQQTLACVEQAKALGFPGINLDLVYGLPGQTQETFRKTLEGVLALSPNRLAIYGFAYLPSLLTHQKALPAERLPKPEQRMELLLQATETLEAHGYVAIGMDHFARPDDEMAKAVQDGRIIRNFMGYAVQAGSDCLGFGPSAISDVGDAYLQNEKKLARWQQKVTGGQFAIHKGHVRSRDDQMRRWIIHRLMGTFSLRWDELRAKWGTAREDFQDALQVLEEEVPYGVLELREEGIFITERGKRFVRNLVFPFDAYLKKMKPGASFSRTV